MTEGLDHILWQARAAIIQGHIGEASHFVEKFHKALEQHGLSEDDRQRLEPALAELRNLAGAALKGTKQAHEYLFSILQAAKYLQTYDSDGRRQDDPVAGRRTEIF